MVPDGTSVNAGAEEAKTLFGKRDWNPEARDSSHNTQELTNMPPNGKTHKVLLATCATFRALDAADMVDRDGITIRQAIRKTGASLGYTITSLRLSPEQREAVRRGEASLSAFHADPPITNKMIDAFITKVGLERVWQRLDYLTMPTLIAAE